MTDAPGPLQLATEDELVNELRGRYQALIVVGARKGKRAGVDQDEVQMRWDGSRSWCLGLAEHARCRLALPSMDISPGDPLRGP